MSEMCRWYAVAREAACGIRNTSEGLHRLIFGDVESMGAALDVLVWQHISGRSRRQTVRVALSKVRASATGIHPLQA